MAISEEQVRHVAILARLALDDERIHVLRDDLNSILGHIDTIQQLDLSDVEPTAHALDIVNSMRPDVEREVLDRTETLRNAPDSSDGAFLIPRIAAGKDEA